MSDRTFIDTNVLIYAHDFDVPQKRAVAQSVLWELWESRSGVLSVQVLQEFYVNVTRKIKSPLTKEVARQIVSSYSTWCRETSLSDVVGAFRIEDSANISFWDSLIVASAIKCGASRLLSEDLHPSQVIAGIRIENPFLSIR